MGINTRKETFSWETVLGFFLLVVCLFFPVKVDFARRGDVARRQKIDHSSRAILFCKPSATKLGGEP